MTPNNVLARITISGEVRSKKNSKVVGKQRGRVYVGSSKAHKEWHHDALRQIVEWRIMASRDRRIPEWSAPLSIYIDIYRRTLGHYDPDNMGASVLDALVDGQVVPRDGFPLVYCVRARHAGKDAENPRAEVTIYAGDNGPTYGD